MIATFLIPLIGIAVLDSLNPTLFVAQFYLLTTPQPTPRILAYIAGVLTVNFGGGLLILGGMRQLVTDLLRQASPDLLNTLQLALGIALIIFGLWSNATADDSEARKPRSLRPIHTFALGMVVMLNELTTALPYFVAIERIAQAELHWLGNILALALYNAIFALPLIAFLVLLITFRQRFADRLARITRGLQIWMPRAIKYGSLAFGAALFLNAMAYFATGVALFG